MRYLQARLGASFFAALAFLIHGHVQAYNSEEHKLIVDKAIAEVTIPPIVRLPAGVEFASVGMESYVASFKTNKKLAIGFDTNNEGDYDKWIKGVQDNCYWTGFGQAKYNKKIWIPSRQQAPKKVLLVQTHVADSPTPFTFGDLVALYGDYRRTTHCAARGACYITDANVEKMNFGKGTRFYRKYCPDSVSADRYLGAVASGVVPPFGEAGNATSNTASDTEYQEAGWWGDEMLRIANVNDWHFSNAAIAWYTGLHRLALLYVDKARDDPTQWVHALHYEANALHSLTDLFAFGHVVTNRGETSYGILKSASLLEKPAYKWMANVIKVGGGTRDSNGKVTLGVLPRISDVPSIRNDFVKSYRGTWTLWADSERRYHDEFNKTGSLVRNLNGTLFQIYGDGKLHEMQESDQGVVKDAVKASVQALFDAYTVLEAETTTVADLGRAGSPYFAALTYVPVYVDSDASKYFLGMWTLFAKAVDDISGAAKVPSNWDKCKIPYLYGKDFFWPKAREHRCSAYPGSGIQ